MLQQGGGVLKLGETPIGPTLAAQLLPGRRQPGPRRGRARALRRPHLAHDRDRVGRDLQPARDIVGHGGRLLRRGHRQHHLARAGRGLGVPCLPAGDLDSDRSAHPGPQDRPLLDQRFQPLAADPDHRLHLRALRCTADARRGAVRAREGVHRGRNRPGRVQPAADLQRDPAQRDHRADRAAAADDRHNHPHRVGALATSRSAYSRRTPAGARSSTTASSCSTRGRGWRSRPAS